LLLPLTLTSPVPARPGSLAHRTYVSASVPRSASIRLKQPVEEVVTELELEDPMPLPPPRSEETPGYVAPPELRTWEPFTYSQPHVRRDRVRQYTNALAKKMPLPPLRIVLIGGVAAGKGTIAPMLSQAFRARVVGIGALLRSEARAARPRGRQAQSAMAEGKLLPDSLVLEMLQERLGGAGAQDIAKNGWLLDGFPRTRSQAEAMLSDSLSDALRPDAIVLIERPDELVREFALGRCTDSATGQTYHPVYAPPPKELYDRLVWRVDDTCDTLDRRIADHKASIEGILAAFEDGSVPIRRFDNARSELSTFGDVASFLEGVAMAKLAAARDRILRRQRKADAEQGWGEPLSPYLRGTGAYAGKAFQTGRLPNAAALLYEAATELMPPEEPSEAEDVEIYCAPNEPDGDCVIRYQEEAAVLTSPLLEAARRCNTYDPDDFVPLLVEDDTQVGWLNAQALTALAPHLAVGTTCELVDLCMLDADVGGGARCGPCVRFAPFAGSHLSRSEAVRVLVDELVKDGLIPRAKLRNELQDVHPLELGFVPPSADVEPVLRLERAAMIYFGIPSFGVHVNGWARDPANPESARPHSMWVAKRSLSKATYAGLLDQMVAGGQPSFMSFEENVRKECEEEASLPPDVIDRIRPTGAVSYRYATPKGLSCKTLTTYDIEMPLDLTPLCADGEVEEFQLLPISEVLRSLREDLPLWKPNSALVAIDFCVRHGMVDPSEPGYVELTSLLRN
jgi:adenylate kinase family enzyme/8-oxo-dGTP pyrophosphatase MutT (NUDIX family)